MLIFESYTSQLLAALDIHWEDEAHAGTLLEDVGMDSMDLFELVVFTERIAGLEIPPDQIPDLMTLGDAYNYYIFAVGEADSFVL